MKKFFLSIFIGFVVWAAGFCLFNHHIFHYKTDEAEKTDAIIVLTGGRNRIIEAVRLLQMGLAEKMFISGVDQNSSLKAIEKANAINLAANPQIFIGKKALDTVGNASEAAEWINKNKISSIRLVTSNYHLPRSLLEFQAKNKGLAIVLHPVYSEKVSKKWWKRWKTGKLIAAEYNKFLYVYVRNLFCKRN